MIHLKDDDNVIRGIFISDIHVGASKDVDHLYKELESYLIEAIHEVGEDLSFVIIGGDLYDREIGMNEKPGRVASKLVLTLNNLSIQYDFFLGIIKGTLRHDYNQLEVFRKLEQTNDNFKIFNTATVHYLETDRDDVELKFLMLPEEYIEDEEKFYEEFLLVDEDEKYDMIFAHATFDFAGYVAKLCTSEKQVKNAITFKASRFCNIVHGITLTGHIHTKIEDENNGVYYPGSFSRTAFGEEDPKGFYYVEYDMETLETALQFIENELAPTYVTIDGDSLPKDIEKKAKKIKKLREKYDHIRIKSTQTIDNDEDLKILREYAEKNDDIKVEIKKIEMEDTDTDDTYNFVINRELDLPETVSKYIQIKVGENVSPEVVKDIIT